MSYPVSLPFSQSYAKHRTRKIRDFARRAVRGISVPQSVRRIAQMPLTVLGIASISTAILTVSLAGGLAFIGLVLIGLEYLVSDEV